MTQQNGDSMTEVPTNMENVAMIESITKEWERIVSNPEVLTDLSEKKVAFAAGGGLVKQFGNEQSVIWKTLKSKAVEGKTSVAEVEFSVTELENIGSFYRFLADKGFNFHCIDERLEGDEQHLHDEVHNKCGACAAVAGASGLENVEDLLLDELGQKVKQEVYGDMPNHESLAILVDLRGADVVLGQLREGLKAKKALPFNVSIPLEEVSEWADQTGNDGRELVTSLVKWNVQIARNIIGGHHNELHQLQDQTLQIVDTRGVSDNPLKTAAFNALDQVQHGRQLQIAA